MAPPRPPARPNTHSHPHAEKSLTRAARPPVGPNPKRQPDDDWQERGACRDANPALFFAADRESPLQRRVRESAAKAICAQCPVRAACRAYAVQTGELYGIWGGMTEGERTTHSPDGIAGRLRRRDRLGSVETA
jgi:WhiB family transcriptional regulator, redox-sensing transcriptional regulator